MKIETLKGRITQDIGKIVLSVALITGTSMGAYLLGNYNGLNEGKRIGKEEVIEAKFLEDVERRSKILRDDTSDFFELLEWVKRSDNTYKRSDNTYKYAFPNKKKK